MTTVGILAFVVALLVSVMLHEAGHFVTARHYGMKATQFFVGFGPTIFSRTKGETEYGVKAIPAGGFVKIVGMTPLEEVEPGDEDRLFYKQPASQKTVVLAAGSTVHFLICIVLIFATIVALGVPDGQTPVLTKPSACLATTITQADVDNNAVKDTPGKDGSCPSGTVPGVAVAAGLRAGDRVLSVDGKAITKYVQLQKLIRASAGRTMHVVVKRSGGTKTIALTPVLTSRPDLNHPATQVKAGAIGVSLDTTTLRQVGFVGAFGETGTQLKVLVTGTYDTFTKKLGTIGGVYGKHRDPQGVVGVVGAGRVSGEVFNAPVPFATRLLGFLFLIAGLNLFVGVFNLFPLLPLDGGHIAVVFFEAARDKIKRARGYVGEVKRVDYNKLMPLTFGVVVLFVGFTFWILGADIVNPIRITQ